MELSEGVNLLEVRNLGKKFPVGERFFGAPRQWLHAVRDAEFDVARKSVFGIVGESGSGKSTIANMISGVHRPSSGQILFKGQPLTGAQEIRRGIQMVFQDPETSLDPRKTVRFLVGEGLALHRMGTRSERDAKVRSVLSSVGLSHEVLNKYPHELSGGQRQRVAVARALILQPELLVLDEPTSALDVSVQAQILNLFMDLQRTFSLTYIFITHDLKIVSHFADNIAVFYLGKIVEIGPVNEVVDQPRHPYTRALLDSVPDPGKALNRNPVKGEIPSPLDPPAGCAFRTRCPLAQDICCTAPEYKIMQKSRILCHLA